MAGEHAQPLVVRQPRLGEDAGGATAALTAAFREVRDAVAAERPVVLVLDDRDLLGQGEVVDATVATGLLGLMRAVAIEGAKPDWRVNAVTHRGEEDERVEDAVAWVAGSGLSGQLIRVGTEGVGKVSP